MILQRAMKRCSPAAFVLHLWTMFFPAGLVQDTEAGCPVDVCHGNLDLLATQMQVMQELFVLHENKVYLALHISLMNHCCGTET